MRDILVKILAEIIRMIIMTIVRIIITALTLIRAHHKCPSPHPSPCPSPPRCEVMTQCGWGKHVPFENYGMKLDRPHVLQFFIDLRRKGIRAHIWP
jgi:hypothetical protein